VLSDLVAAETECALVSFPRHANVGDSAIWLGERALLRDLGAVVVYTCDLTSFSERDLRERLPAGTILIHGGGNLGDLWPQQQDFRERIIATFPHHRIIQLPQSIHFSSRANLDRARSVLDGHPDLTILVRDHRSLDVAEAQFTAHSLLCPDLAFAIADRPDVGPDAAGPAARDVVWLARSDHESAQQPLPPFADDVLVTDWAADEGATPDWTARVGAAAEDYRDAAGGSVAHAAAADRLAALQLQRGCRLLSSGMAVATDRLHGHLLCLMLGRPHVILNDRHGKLASTYATWTCDSPLARWARTPADALARARALAADASSSPFDCRSTGQ
jgi:exopolysaccharide biosynthesis predicted pyruvyltransferase EpsI